MAGNLFRMASLACAAGFASAADLLGGVAGGPTGVGAAVAAPPRAVTTVVAAAGVVVGATPNVVHVKGAGGAMPP